MVRIGFGQREVGFEKGLAGKFGFVYSLRTPPQKKKKKTKTKNKKQKKKTNKQKTKHKKQKTKQKKGDALAVLLFCSYTLLVFRCHRATTPAWTIYNKTV